MPLPAEKEPEAQRSPMPSPTGIVRNGTDETRTLVVEPLSVCQAGCLPGSAGPVGPPGGTSPGTEVLKGA